MKTTFEAASRRVLPGGLLVPVMALLSMTFAANADSRSSAIQIVDVDMVQAASVGARNECWDDAPMDAVVRCAPPWPEHGSLIVKLNLDQELDFDLEVAYETMDITATGGTDYVAQDGTLTIPAGEVEKTLHINFIDDLVEEGNEDFVVKFTTPEESNIAFPYVHQTLIDEESIKFKVLDTSRIEGHPIGMLVQGQLSESVFWPFRVRMVTTAGTAGPSDYRDADELTDWLNPDSESRRGFGFWHEGLIDDSLDEPDEKYTITISGNDYLSMDSDSGIMTILDDDDPPSVSIADDSGREDAVGQLSFDVTLGAASGKEITLNYATADDTAASGSDYDSKSGTLTFAAGDVKKTVEVSVTPDDVHEPDEKFNVTLSDGINVTLGDSTAVGTIQNDDPELSIADAAASEADGELEFVVRADGLVKTNQTVTVSYQTEDGTATAGSDYEANSGTLSFTSTNTEQTVAVNVIDDEVDEPEEKLFVNLIRAANASIGDARAEGTIQDNDATSSGITLTAAPDRVSEGDGATDVVVTATLDGGTRTEATEVVVNVAGSGNTDAVGFQDVSSFAITIAAGDGSGEGTFTLTPINDEVDESDETLSVTGTSVLPVTGTEVELVDDDATSTTFALTASPDQVSEGDGATDITVTATFDAGARTEDTPVRISVLGSTNTDAVDFAEVQDFIITIPANKTSGTETFTLTPEDDNVDESDNWIFVAGTTTIYSNQRPPHIIFVTTEIVLADDDATSTNFALTASPSRVSEGDGATDITVTATFDAGARTVDTPVRLWVSGSGNADAVGFAEVQDFTITIAANNKSGTGNFTLTPEDDNVDESDETLFVWGRATFPINEGTHRILDRSTEVELVDDDATSTSIALTAEPPRVSEGDGATSVRVTATFDAAVRTEATTVSVSVSGSGAVDAVDFTPVSAFEIVIPADAASGTGTFTLTPEDDALDEVDETLTVSGAADLPVQSAQVALVDDDQAPTRILLSVTPSRVAEDGGAAEVTVTAAFDRGARPTAATVSVSVSGSGDAGAVDFAPVPDFEIVIPANAASGAAAFTLTPEDDAFDEVDETLTVSGAADLPVRSATVTLADDDEAPTRISLSVSPPRASEGGGAIEVSVTAAFDRGARPTATTVSVSVSGSGAAGAVDFAPVPAFEIVVPANAATGSAAFTLAPEDDAFDEVDETLTVSGAADLPVRSATVTLADDDQAPTRISLSVSPPRASEGGGAIEVSVTAAFDRGARPTATTVTVSVAGSGAAGAVDFAPVPGFEIVIPASAASAAAAFALTPEDDVVDEADETLTVSGASDLPVEPALVTLADDDATSTRISLSAAPALVSEGAGTTEVTVTATLDGGARAVATTVAVSVAGSGGAGKVGFSPVSGFEIEIPAGDRSARGAFSLAPEDDNVAEAGETLAVSGMSELPVEPAQVTLTDDDAAPSGIVLSAAPAAIPEDAGSTEVTVTAALNGAARASATTVTVTVSGSGDADAVDFAPVPAFDIEIAAGDTSASGAFTLAPEDDAFDEADETVTISGAANLPVESARVTLADDDQAPARISLSAVPSRVSEDGGATGVTVTAALDRGVRPTATTVSVSVSGSGDAGAVDFAPVADFEIVVPANAASGAGTFTLAPEDDAFDEADETVTVSGASDLPVESAEVTLADDDQAPTRISLSAVPSRVSEGGGATAVTVTAAFDRGARPTATTVSVSVSGSGDAGAVDFAPVADFEIVVPANAASGAGTFTLTPEDDALDEADETVTISGAANLPVESARVTLADDDQAPTRISLSASPARVSEGGGATAVTVTAALDRGVRPTATTVSVSVSGSGDAGAVDFAPVADFEIVVPANAASGAGTFTLAPEDDAFDEADETVTVSGAANLPVESAQVTLADDDQAPTRISLSASPARVSEGGGATAVTVTAALDRGVRPTATTVSVSVSGSGDAGAVDFAPVPGFEIVVPANAASGAGTFTLTPEDDALDEADETVTVSGASDLPVEPAEVTLADDDQAPTRISLSASPARVSEGGGATAVTVTAALDRGARPMATTVTVSVAGSGDPDAADFAPVPDFDITIPANAASGAGAFTLAPEDDAKVESDERLTISGASDLPVAPTAIALADDDEVSTRILLFLTVDPPRASEGDGEIRVTVTAAVDKGVRPDETRISVSVSGGGDPDAVDFDPVPDFDIVIPANAPNGTGTFSVVPEDDLIAEKDEVLTVSGASDLPVTPATVELLDDDEASGRVLLSADPARVSEGGGPVAVTVTAALDRGLRQEATTVTVSVSGGGDPDAVDFAPVANFGITIAANAPSGTGTFTLTPEDDAEDEADETLALTGEADLPVTPASVVLADDDEMTVSRVLSIADAQASEGAGEVRFAVTLDGPSAAEVTADYATVNPVGSSDPVAEPGIDYKSVAGTLTFAPGEVSKTIRVPIVDDDLDEPDETFALVLSDLRGATLGRGSARGAILDDDEPPALSIAGDTGPEDVGELVFSVTLMARALTEVTVNYATMDDTAVAGDDYGQVEGTLTFAPGETAKRIRVAVVDDAVDEADEEVFAVRLSGPSGATLAHALATGVIRDDDEPPALSVADAAGDEDVGALEFAVTLSAPSGIEVSAPYATKDGTATAGSDYAAATGSLVFAPGEVSRTIRVAILDDALHEADEETFELTLARLVNATPADVSATGTIRDNDLAPPSVAGDLPAALLCVGGAPYELDLANYFAGEELRFSAVSSTPLVATAALDGSKLTVAPASEGASSVTVTATNDAGSVGSSIGVRVVTDAAELEAVESVLASIGRAVLTGVTDSVRARFDPGRAFGDQSASTSVQRGRTQVVPDAYSVIGSQRPGAPMPGARSVGWDGSGLFQPQISGDDWFETMNRTYRGGMVPFSFSLDSAQSPSTGPAWGVWGRADAHRFESGTDGSSHDGTLTAVHLGADARVGDWLAGVSVARSAAQADYRFERSVDACGGSGSGEGMVDAELTSVHPYVGRQIGRGQVWATLGAGGGEVSVERCETGQRNDADLSMRLAALGGRHPFAGGEPIELSVVEEIGVLDLTTGNAVGPVGDRSVRVGQARFGLEASGVAPAGCDCSLTTFVRAFARGDWGDGATGTGLELAAGVRFRNLPRRLGIDAGVRALAAHSAEDAEERSANLSFSMLPKADGTGWQASMTWRLGASEARLDALGGITRWTAPSGSLPGAKRHWLADSRLGYGIRLRRGFATPFVELDAGHSQRGGARFGMRHEYGDRARGLVVEWGVKRRAGVMGMEDRFVVTALGRF